MRFFHFRKINSQKNVVINTLHIKSWYICFLVNDICGLLIMRLEFTAYHHVIVHSLRDVKREPDQKLATRRECAQY